MAPSLFKSKSTKKKKEKDDVNQHAEPEHHEEHHHEEHKGGEGEEGHVGEGGEGDHPDDADADADQQPAEGSSKPVWDGGQLAQILKLLKKAITLKDLDSLRISLPASMHECDTGLERMMQMRAPDLFLAIADANSPTERLAAITRLYLANFQHFKVMVKKPFNPLQGELFLCDWNLADGQIEYISEQVSHHPPSFAFVCKHVEKGITYFGQDRPSGSFTGTAMKMTQKGFQQIHLAKFNETYELKAPAFCIRGLLVGRPFLEILGDAVITCKETGYRSKIHFKEKPWIGGEYRVITGVFTDGSQKELATLSGNWAKKVDITYVDQEATVFHDFTTFTPTPYKLPVTDTLNEMESQKLWQNVFAAMKAGDFHTADKHKNHLEHVQRQHEGTTFQPELFELDKTTGFFHPKPHGDLESIRKSTSGWLPKALAEEGKHSK